MNAIEIKDKLVSELSQNNKIKGIGQTGDINADLILGNSDIDMFVLCTTIPTEAERKSVYSNYSNEYSECLMNVCNGGVWGYGDILIIDGIDVMFMYFTTEEMEYYLDDVLNGKHLDREGGFYPTGRLSSVESINIENSLDHLLQALFAINFMYFPSRKRSEQYIKEFKNKPDDCYDRLLKIIENSISNNAIVISV